MIRNEKNMLSGSTLVEAIVASSVFLIVFMLSLQTLTQITTGKSDDQWILIDADHKADVQFARYGTGKYPDGSYIDEYEWGRMVTEITAYNDYSDLQAITIRAEIKNSRHKITYRYIVERSY